MRRWALAALGALLMGCGDGRGGAAELPGDPSADPPADPPAVRPADPAAQTPAWGRSFGDPALAAGYGVAGAEIAAGPDGGAIIAGDFRGAIGLEAAPMVSSGESDVFVAGLDAAGEPRWSLQIGGAAEQIFSGLAVDGAGNVLVAGVFSGTMSIGGGSMTAQGLDVFLVKIDPDGQVLWTRRYGNNPAESVQWAHAVAADGEGNILLAGNLEGTLDFGGLNLTHGALFPFVVKLDPEGAPLWSASFEGSVDQEIVGLGADAAGNVLVAGHAERSEIGGVQLAGAGEMDLLAASFTPAGALRWARLVGSEDDELLLGMAVDPAGALILSGSFDGALDVDGIPLAASGGYTGLVAKLDADDGEAAWARALPHGAAMADVAVDGAGDVLAAGTLTVDVSAAGPTGSDALVMQLDGDDGATRWTGRFGDEAEQQATSVAADPLGRALVAGVHAGSLEIGGAELQSESGHDLFAAAIAPHD